MYDQRFVFDVSPVPPSANIVNRTRFIRWIYVVYVGQQDELYAVPPSLSSVSILPVTIFWKMVGTEMRLLWPTDERVRLIMI